MKDKDLRKAQIGLLRFEQKIKDAAKALKATGALNKGALLAGLPALTASAAMAAERLGSEAPLQFAAAAENAMKTEASADSWLMNLAEIISTGHAAIERTAVEGAFRLLADGGTPKEEPPVQVVASLLGLG